MNKRGLNLWLLLRIIFCTPCSRFRYEYDLLVDYVNMFLIGQFYFILSMWTQNIVGPEFVIGMDYYELCFFAILIPFLNIRKVLHQFMWSVSYLYNPGRYFKTYVYLQIRFPVVQKLDCIFFYDERWGDSFVNKRNN